MTSGTQRSSSMTATCTSPATSFDYTMAWRRATTERLGRPPLAGAAAEFGQPARPRLLPSQLLPLGVRVRRRRPAELAEVVGTFRPQPEISWTAAATGDSPPQRGSRSDTPSAPLTRRCPLRSTVERLGLYPIARGATGHDPVLRRPFPFDLRSGGLAPGNSTPTFWDIAPQLEQGTVTAGYSGRDRRKARYP